MFGIFAILGCSAAVLVMCARLTDSGTRAPAKPAIGSLHRPAMIIYAVTMFGLCVLALTGFVGWFAFGRLGGWLLFVHVLGTPVFVIGLTILAVVWAEKSRFADSAPGGFSSGQKAAFWAFLLLGFVAIVSMLAAMLPVFGYDWQQTLCAVHRYNALGLVAVAVVHACLTLPPRPGKTE